jgi:protein arginine kinase
MSTWYEDKGPENDVIISSRIRLARNFKDIPFPGRMNKEHGNQVLERSRDAIFKSNSVLSNQFDFVSIGKLDVIDRQVMVEKHFISPEMLQNVDLKAVMLSYDKKVSIMLNEEDHLRIQSIFPGMQLDEAWDLANKVDNVLEENIEYAFSENYGYLTCCPTNVGTGLRASVMLHLPALSMTGHLNSLLNAVSKLGIAVRGLYGEGSSIRGNIFQISNQITLGISEEETVENLKDVVKQIVDQERNVREKVFQQNRLKLEDRVYRSYGILTNSRIMTSEEFMKVLSNVRLGVDMGIIKDIPIEMLNELMVITQPANIMKRHGDMNIGTEKRDMIRAQLIREKFKKVNN